MSVGERIKELRLNKGMTMEEFANLIDSGKSNVSRWERGENIPNDLTLTKIAELGDISVEELLYGKQGKITTNNITATPQGNKYTIVIKEGNQDRWITVDKDTARELVEKLGSVLNG